MSDLESLVNKLSDKKLKSKYVQTTLDDINGFDTALKSNVSLNEYMAIRLYDIVKTGTNKEALDAIKFICELKGEIPKKSKGDDTKMEIVINEPEA